MKLLQPLPQRELQLYEVELDDEKVLVNDELDDEKLDERELEVMEQVEDDEHKQEETLDEVFELINSMVEIEVELTDIEVEVDGMDEIEVYEMVAEMMINDEDEEVDMLYQQHLALCLHSDDEVHREIIEALLLYLFTNDSI